jgi:hypothetical protein
MIDKMLDGMWRILKIVVILLALMFVIGLLFSAWFALSFWIWGSHGTDVFQWWLMISALLVALILVLIW